MNVIAWKAWYTDSEVYTSDTTDWEDLPDTGLLYCVCIYDEYCCTEKRYRHLAYGYDYYYTLPETGMKVHCADSTPPEAEDIKDGEWEDDTEFNALWSTVHNTWEL